MVLFISYNFVKGFIATNIYEVNSRGNKNRTLDAEDTLGSFSESHRKERKPSPEKGKTHTLIKALYIDNPISAFGCLCLSRVLKLVKI